MRWSGGLPSVLCHRTSFGISCVCIPNGTEITVWTRRWTVVVVEADKNHTVSTGLYKYLLIRWGALNYHLGSHLQGTVQPTWTFHSLTFLICTLSLGLWPNCENVLDFAEQRTSSKWTLQVSTIREHKTRARTWKKWRIGIPFMKLHKGFSGWPHVTRVWTDQVASSGCCIHFGWSALFMPFTWLHNLILLPEASWKHITDYCSVEVAIKVYWLWLALGESVLRLKIFRFCCYLILTVCT